MAEIYGFGESGGAAGTPGREYRRYVRRICSVAGFSLAAMMALLQLIGLGLGLLSRSLESRAVTGVGGELLKLLRSDWFSLAGSNLLAYAIVLPIVGRILAAVPEIRVEQRRLRAGKFFLFLILAFGGGYAVNLAGSLVNFFLSSWTGRSLDDMAPLSNVLQNLNGVSAIYISVIAPVIEEVIFRKMLLNRLRPLGERAAVVFTAVMFGLMHGNISQILYAAVIGIVLGYVAVKTGRILYTILIHAVINSFSTALAVELLGMSGGAAVSLHVGLMLLLAPLVILGSMIAAVVLFCIYWKRAGLKRGDWPEGVEYRDFSSALFVNPGVLLFALLSLGMTVYYAFFS